MSTLRLAGIASAVTIAIALAGCSTPAAPDRAGAPSIEQRISAAHTRADHEDIAAYYDQQAAAALAQAETHRRLAVAYAAQPPGGRGGGGMAAHCRQLVTSYEGAAKTYQQMAAEHRQMAADAGN